MRDNSALLTVEELAEYLHVPLRTVYGWRSRGCGPPGIRVGRHIRYRGSAVDQWLDTKTDTRSAAS